MNESYNTMLDYEKVLENVGKILPRIHGGNVRGSVHGGAHLVDEEEKDH
jgi:homoserine kinase